MPEKIADPPAVRGVLRFLLRLPAWLYRQRWGWLLGDRFLLLHHVGRQSGRAYHTVLEVVQSDTAAGCWTVASGWGEASDWVQNLMANPSTSIQIGNETWQVMARRLEPEQAASVIAGYGERNPFALVLLARLMGYRVARSEEDFRALGRMLVLISLMAERPHEVEA